MNHKNFHSCGGWPRNIPGTCLSVRSDGLSPSLSLLQSIDPEEWASVLVSAWRASVDESISNWIFDARKVFGPPISRSRAPWNWKTFLESNSMVSWSEWQVDGVLRHASKGAWWRWVTREPLFRASGVNEQSQIWKSEAFGETKVVVRCVGTGGGDSPSPHASLSFRWTYFKSCI